MHNIVFIKFYIFLIYFTNSSSKDREKLLIITPRVARKVENLRTKPNVYFSIDDENFPCKGVKGKGTATLIDDPKRTVPYGEDISDLIGQYMETRKIQEQENGGGYKN